MSAVITGPHLGSKEYQAINEAHCANPQPGDYWHEMFCPYLVVLVRIGNHIIVYKTRKDAGKNHWTWDTNKPEMMSLAELRKEVTYSTMQGFVADVAPGSHREFADYFVKQLPVSDKPDETLPVNSTGTDADYGGDGLGIWRGNL